eukprot:CAMPEP_0172678078 /NCGR_PEP_ID=MMETSP1074-20121228/15122_1 /TAXON_ID=2916 /ORGANISM="Ceratium fusus, Strain PA161109" /LENGTH=94 /DNA_ID=CAMNT_0013496027 /DNA_START=51 /DNA_END=336 /DNA_ORIENTATION=+
MSSKRRCTISPAELANLAAIHNTVPEFVQHDVPWDENLQPVLEASSVNLGCTAAQDLRQLLRGAPTPCLQPQEQWGPPQWGFYQRRTHVVTFIV